MEKRVYRGKCPCEELFEIKFNGDCRNCERYFKCKRKERKRRKHVRQCIMFWILVVIAVIAITALVMLISFNTEASEKDRKQAFANSTIIIDSGVANGSKILIDVDVSPAPSDPPTQESNSSIIIENNIEVITSTSQQTVIEILPSISATGPGQVYYYELTYEDKIYLAKVVYAESRGEVFEGQVAVASTALNRYYSDDARFDRTSIYSVITQPNQYASIENVTMEDLEKCPSCMEAVEAACKGWDPTRAVFEDGAKFFFNPDGDLSESAREARTGIETYRIGSHLFHNDFNQ